MNKGQAAQPTPRTPPRAELGALGARERPSSPPLPAPAAPAAVLASPSPESRLLFPRDVCRTRAFLRLPPHQPGVCSDAAEARAQPRARGELTPHDREGRPGTGRNTAPASTASFAGAVLQTSAKTTPARCPLRLKHHRQRKLPSGSRGAALCQAAALWAGAGRKGPRAPREGDSALSPGQAQG